ncbi:tryptophan--tRNA ligase, putative [Plasmodium gallinaceum]|uniref:Tryptophan--tRNA ligase, putative n=1 Tax=Plasmodium gallinaceum TaxID=5849 RepID=A0A1J1H0T7_PLAGA|nr:tryptophan--tRNA ligase, putative [Plasmodium gallinaceum]CRG97146.1 tryptophan--tRNA ligase, putative [Plasmodium gallinaceum]
MRKENILILSFLLFIQVYLCKNVKVRKFKGSVFYLFREIKIYKKKVNFQVKNSCTFLTGIKPSGDIHLGNYIGCLHPIINLEAKRKKNFINEKKEQVIKLNKIILIADLHCLTNLNNIFSLKKNVLDTMKVIISLIIDMFIKKKKYIDIYINDIKLEKILKLFKCDFDSNISKFLPSSNSNISQSFFDYEKELNNLNINNTHNIKDHIFSESTESYNNYEENTDYHHEKYYEKNIHQKHFFYIFRQSDIQVHTSLYYLINSFTSINLLNSHVHIKTSGYNKSVSLLSYPNLMLSDILLYKPNYLIIGLDQNKNVEIIKKICKKMNNYFPSVAKMPEIYSRKFNIEIMNLDGHRKMSKNDLLDNLNFYKIIYLFDEKDIIEKKIKKSKTDNFNYLKYGEANRREINNLINIYIFFYYYKIKSISEKIKKYHKTLYSLEKIFLNETEKNSEGNKTTYEFSHNEKSTSNDIKYLNFFKNSIDVKNSLNIINEDKLFFKKNNINPNFNEKVVNNILSSYNNNYYNFKNDLTLLISYHFLTSKYYYNFLLSKDNLINKILKMGKRSLSIRAIKTFKDFKKKLNL